MPGNSSPAAERCSTTHIIDESYHNYGVWSGRPSGQLDRLAIASIVDADEMRELNACVRCLLSGMNPEEIAELVAMVKSGHSLVAMNKITAFAEQQAKLKSTEVGTLPLAD